MTAHDIITLFLTIPFLLYMCEDILMQKRKNCEVEECCSGEEDETVANCLIFPSTTTENTCESK
jgi:hypothetical protein